MRENGCIVYLKRQILSRFFLIFQRSISLLMTFFYRKIFSQVLIRYSLKGLAIITAIFFFMHTVTQMSSILYPGASTIAKVIFTTGVYLFNEINHYLLLLNYTTEIFCIVITCAPFLKIFIPAKFEDKYDGYFIKMSFIGLALLTFSLFALLCPWLFDITLAIAQTISLKLMALN